MVGKKENIYIEVDKQNIIIVDPNKVVDEQNIIRDREIHQEDLVMYANLECRVQPRTRLAKNATGIQNDTVSIAEINFLRPEENNYLGNGYLDELTGKDSDIGGDVNSSQITLDAKSKRIYETTNNQKYNNLLLIESIKINTKIDLYPQVTIVMEDIRGRALFEQGENSPYATFFNLPYPTFTLTVKGYLGKAIKYQLNLVTFTASFNTKTGNFKITTTFQTYKYGVLPQLQYNHIKVAPYMYEKTTIENPFGNVNTLSSQITNDQSQNRQLQIYETFGGYQTIQEVYATYKSKGLIPQDFPELTILQLINRLDTLEQYIQSTFQKMDLTAINQAEYYKKTLQQYFDRVKAPSTTDSWYNNWIDTENYLITKDNQKVYPLKFISDPILRNKADYASSAKTSLEVILQDYNKRLSQNLVYSEDNIKLGGEVVETKINNPITYNTFTVDVTPENIDLEATWKSRGQAKQIDKLVFNEAITKQLINLNLNKYPLYQFELFTNTINRLLTEVEKKEQEIEDILTKQFTRRITDTVSVLGFKPILRNVLAVLFANMEGFLRLMGKVHSSAWELRNSPIRRNAILGNNKNNLSPDGSRYLQGTTDENIPIYPWPHYFVEKTNNNSTQYVLEFPGNASEISTTKGDNYVEWPEIEFIEEFLKSITRTQQTIENKKDPLDEIINSEQYVKKYSALALNYPTKDIIFSRKEVNNFLYELYERSYVTSAYQRFVTPEAQNIILPIIANGEFLNIKNSIEDSSQYLATLIKNYAITSANIIPTLFNISNDGTGSNWQKYIRDIFVTDYLQQEVENDFLILDEQVTNPNVNNVQPQPKNFTKFKNFITTDYKNSINMLDTYPFVLDDWYKNNMANGGVSTFDYLYNTAKVYDVHDTKKVVSNFNVSTTKREKRPLTSFNLYNATKPEINNTLYGFKNFYVNRTLGDGHKNQQITEGTVSYYEYDGNISPVQTTSIFNTPYFVNAIQEGVNNWLSGETYPYVASAYLFVNSLPLGTLREKYKTFTPEMNEPTDLDYIFATLKKYGAIHRVPYAWILKYGSIWHRYKKFITEDVDILQSIWNDFDVINNFDPISNNVGKTYNLYVPGTIGTSKIVLEKTTPTAIGSVTQMNVGFYPKLINDYNLFFRGKPLFSAYTDSEIQSKIYSYDGFVLNTFFETSFDKKQGYDTSNPTDTLSFNTWNCTLIDKDGGLEYVVPSFGGTLNQLNYECFNDNGEMIVPLKSNYSVYNGSVRGFWALPNYGYFNNSQIDVPSPYEYMKIILSGSQFQEAFSLRGTRNYTEYSNGYTTIEEIFSVFTKKMLDLMETQFLLFSRSMYSYTQESINNTLTPKVKIDNFTTQSNSTYKNFQILMKELMSINLVSSETGNNLFNVRTITNNQFDKINSVLKGFMEFDVIMKIGNPGNFNRRLYDSYSTKKFIEDKITFPLYQNGSLPNSSTSGLTLNYFKNLNPAAWQALLLYVGFSTVSGIRYSNVGSTITDFFIDNNIEFTEDSVQTLEPLIKSYATLKKKSPSYDKEKFTEAINNHISNNEKYSNEQIDATTTEVRQNQIENLPTKPTAFIGEQTKIDLYETFKGLNDKWIAGCDYAESTLFEDVLIIDRANRNISEEILIDPQTTKRIIEGYSYNPSVSVSAIIYDLIYEHNLIPMQHPAYVNYYNVHNVEEVIPKLDENMGDLLFGTFLDVDTKQSKPKLICMYNWVGSQYLDITKNQYATDSFFPWDNNVLEENITSDKKDWYFSNRVVGFSVDIGSKNQSVFKHFEVDQSNGKQTTESLEQILRMYDNTNGQKVATQNNSLWNYYKSRQYYCKVESLGAPLIQPTMYFVVKYVPMFYGTYMIHEVTHTIGAGTFDTQFIGARQSVFSYGAITNYLQLFTKKLFTKYKRDLNENVNTNKDFNTNLNSNPNTINNTPTDSKLSKNSQILPGPNTGNVTISVNGQQYLVSPYNNFIPVQQNTTITSSEEVARGIEVGISGPSSMMKSETYQLTNIKNLINTKVISFVTCYMESYVQNEFKTYNNNFAGIKLDYKWPGNMSSFFNNEYISRIDGNGLPYPYATFEDKQKVFDMLIAKWGPRSNTFTIEPESITKTWITQWSALSPYKKSMTDDEFENYKQTNQTQYQQILKRITDGIELAKTLNLVNIYI
jgi:hypothetical protein